jgi:hypothetical protein
MPSVLSIHRGIAALLASLACAMGAQAGEPRFPDAAPGEDTVLPGTLPATPDPAPRVVDGIGRPLDATALEAFRGGDDVENSVDINGAVTDNHADHIVSGHNVVQGDAFGNAAGINTLIQNSGSNVLIQNGMTVNVQFADPGE